MKVVITGVNGFVGSTLFKHLAAKHEVIGLYNSGAAKFTSCYKTDLTDEANVDEAFSKIGKGATIVHLASQMAEVGNLNDVSVLTINAAISKNIATAAKKYEAGHIINMSSSAVYPNIDGVCDENTIPDPSVNNDCIYGLSKLNGEVLFNYFLKGSGTFITHLRSAIVYGEGMNPSRIIPLLEREIAEHNTATLYGNGERLLNLVHVNKLAEYIEMFIAHPVNTVVNIADECISAAELAERIVAEKGNNETQIVLKETGNKSKFILDTTKFKALIKNWNNDKAS